MIINKDMKRPIEGHSGLFKDDNGMIHNESPIDRERYRIAKKQARMNLTTQEEVSNLKNEISEIKSLLKQLLEK